MKEVSKTVKESKEEVAGTVDETVTEVTETVKKAKEEVAESVDNSFGDDCG